MGIYLTPEFEHERLKARINNQTICKTAKAILAGLPGNHLGRYTYKKRLALPSLSPRRGARAKNLKLMKSTLIAKSLKTL